VTTQAQISEAELQQAVIETARTFGFLVAHFRPAKTNKGWRTPVSADGKGFPDLVMVHPLRGLMFAELKSDRGNLSPDQKRWITALRFAGC
jgi:VRR-NUC domain